MLGEYINSDGKVLVHNIVSDLIEKNNYRTFRDTNETYEYNPESGIYEGPRITHIEELSLEMAGTYIKRNHLNEITKILQVKTYFDRQNLADNHPDYICLKNGILNLKTKKISPHTAKIVFLTSLPLEYDFSKECPLIIKFLTEVVGTGSLDVIQELFGYLLMKDTLIQKSFMCIGGGSNGKSTFIDLIKKFLGQNNWSSQSLQDLQENKYAIAELYGKFANIYPDLGKNGLADTDKFKMLTSGDDLSAELKYQRPFKFKFWGKQIYSANELPYSNDESLAFYRRWILIKFSRRFTDKDKDSAMLQKISSNDELSGLLNWALVGYDRLVKNGVFSYPLSSEQIRDEYLQICDSVQAFIDVALVPDYDKYVTKKEVYALYVGFCHERQIPCKMDNSFHRSLKKNMRLTESRPALGGVRERCWEGVGLNPDFSLKKGGLESPVSGKSDINLLVNVHLVQDVQDNIVKSVSNVNVLNNYIEKKHGFYGHPGHNEELTTISGHIQTCMMDIINKESIFTFKKLIDYAKSEICTTQHIEEFLKKELMSGNIYEEKTDIFRLK